MEALFYGSTVRRAWRSIPLTGFLFSLSTHLSKSLDIEMFLLAQSCEVRL
jgi:hypothetical protein